MRLVLQSLPILSGYSGKIDKETDNVLRGAYDDDDGGELQNKTKVVEGIGFHPSQIGVTLAVAEGTVLNFKWFVIANQWRDKKYI